MTALNQIVDYLNQLLNPALFNDQAINGLQVEGSKSELSTVAVAVDAGLSVFEKAIQGGAELLVVHHGLFWGKEQPITGIFGRKISLLLESGCSLYASHLPLDSHLEVGNAGQICSALGLADIAPFAEYRGMSVGAKGTLSKGQPIEYFVQACRKFKGATDPLVLPFGKSNISTVGVVTGSGAFALEAAAEQGLDLFLSGEPKHEVYHRTKEFGLNAIFAGHYATETFGVQALAQRLEKSFGLRCIFIDEKSGI